MRARGARREARLVRLRLARAARSGDPAQDVVVQGRVVGGVLVEGRVLLDGRSRPQHWAGGGAPYLSRAKLLGMVKSLARARAVTSCEGDRGSLRDVLKDQGCKASELQARLLVSYMPLALQRAIRICAHYEHESS